MEDIDRLRELGHVEHPILGLCAQPLHRVEQFLARFTPDRFLDQPPDRLLGEPARCASRANLNITVVAKCVAGL